MTRTFDLKHSDGLEVLRDLPSESVNLILSDFPYGTTSNRWDTPLDLDVWWPEMWRVLVPTGIIALTASQPFTARLVMSQPEMFRHEWIWLKNRGSNFANTVREPMKEHESVLVFSRGKWTYNKQMQERTGGGKDRVKYKFDFKSQSENYREFEGRENQALPDLRVPSSWQKFNVEVGLHPTQKPVDLFRYLIRTYTNEGDLVVDPCAGSATTGIAAMLEGRRSIMAEKEHEYYVKGLKRLLVQMRECNAPV